jgi:hypothetical protein
VCVYLCMYHLRLDLTHGAQDDCISDGVVAAAGQHLIHGSKVIVEPASVIVGIDQDQRGRT